jgi:hypothetical protein
MAYAQERPYSRRFGTRRANASYQIPCSPGNLFRIKGVTTSRGEHWGDVRTAKFALREWSKWTFQDSYLTHHYGLLRTLVHQYSTLYFSRSNDKELLVARNSVEAQALRFPLSVESIKDQIDS